MEVESTNKITSLEKRLTKFAERYKKLGCNNYEEAVEYELDKLNKILNKSPYCNEQ